MHHICMFHSFGLRCSCAAVFCFVVACGGEIVHQVVVFLPAKNVPRETGKTKIPFNVYYRQTIQRYNLAFSKFSHKIALYNIIVTGMRSTAYMYG